MIAIEGLLCIHTVEGVMLSPSLSLHPIGYHEIRVGVGWLSLVLLLYDFKIKNALSISAVLTMAKIAECTRHLWIVIVKGAAGLGQHPYVEF